jgi:uncharacterized membrane protein required for colicin V production
MLMDLLIAFPVIGFTLLGMRDGLVRKLVATLTVIAGLILGHFYMREVGDLLVQYAKVNPRNSAMLGYYAVVFFLFFVQIIIYRFGTENYKMGGVMDKIGGTAAGLIEGIVFTSVFLYISLMSGPYSRDMIRDSQFYETVVNVAPEILDFTTNIGPEAFDSFKGMTTPEKKPEPTNPRRGRSGS